MGNYKLNNDFWDGVELQPKGSIVFFEKGKQPRNAKVWDSSVEAATVPDDYDNMSEDELRELAEENGLTPDDEADRAELTKTLREAGTIKALHKPTMVNPGSDTFSGMTKRKGK